MRNLLISITVISVFAFKSDPVLGQIKLPRIIRDSMVLQRDVPLKLWGWASPNEVININFRQKKYKTRADESGKWIIKLNPQSFGGPFNLIISGKNTVTIHNILIGDVWFCSGQSNMEHQINLHDVTYEDEIATANFPEIRQFEIPNLANLNGPQKDIPEGHWVPAIGNDIRPFSAVAYFFAKRLFQHYHIPIGIINSSVGGTHIESWTSEEGLREFEEFSKIVNLNKNPKHVDSVNNAAIEHNKKIIQLNQHDKGLTEKPHWYENSYKPKGWRNINVPGYWEDQGIKDLDGVVWFRKDIFIPSHIAGKPAKVFLGRIINADNFFVNGVDVGNTTYEFPQRRYKIPGHLLKEGINVFTVRITNQNGKGGFVPDKPYYLISEKDTLDLKGTWHYKVGEVFMHTKVEHPGIIAQNQPAALYNAMVAPFLDFTIRGFLWYQGENNADKPILYRKQLPALINDWRGKWGQGELPFIYAQLPNYMDANYLPSESEWALQRESQLMSLKEPNTGMAVTIDLGEWNDLHPDNKKSVGERLALQAMKISYNEPIVSSGPIVENVNRVGDRIIIHFSNIGSGLITHDGEEPQEFAIAGHNKKFVWANALIENNEVIVWSPHVKEPVYVRYAWADNPVNPNLYNKEGLPASPFRTDK